MSNYFAVLSCVLLLLLHQTSCAKRQLINFQVVEENDVISSELYVDSLVDLSSELKLVGEQQNDSIASKKQKVFDARIDVRLPIPIKIDGQLRMVTSDTNVSQTGSSPQQTLYRLNMNVGEIYRVAGDVNHTQRDDWNEFTSDLDFESLQSGLAGKYRGTLRLAESGCPVVTLYHNLTTNSVDLVRFSSNVTEQCALNQTDHQRNITIDLSNLINDLYDFRLDQTFDWRTTGGSELMTLLNKIYKVTVSGQYDNGQANGDGYQFHKRAIFESSAPSQFPTFQIKYAHDEKSKNKIKLAFEVRNDRRPANKKDGRNGPRNESREGRKSEL